MSEFEFMSQQRVEPMTCPFCRFTFDGVTGLTGDELPDNGNAMLCSECANLSVFDDTCPGRQREPTPEERAEMEADERLMFAQARMRQARGLPPDVPADRDAAVWLRAHHGDRQRHPHVLVPALPPAVPVLQVHDGRGRSTR